MGCYGIYVSPYIIIGVGTDRRLYSRNGLGGNWKIINDSGAGIASVSLGKDGKTIYCVNTSNQVYSKPSWDARSWTGPIDINNGFVERVAINTREKFEYGVGKDNKLYNRNTSLGPQWGAIGYFWNILPDNSLTAAMGSQIYKYNDYIKVLEGNNIAPLTIKSSLNLLSIAVAPDDTLIAVGNDNRLYSAPDYKSISNSVTWKGPEKDSCCVIWITIVPNPEFNKLGVKYSTATSPNFNINAPEYAEIKGQAFWGTGSVGQTTNGTLQDCVASCGSTNGCTGATYNSKNVCMLRSGAGLAVPSNRRDVAIVPKSQQLLQIVTSVNNQLTSVNNKIQDRIRKMKNIYGDQMQMRNIQNYDLISQHEVLQTEREKIKTIVDETQKLENIQDEADIFTTKNYYIFYILSAIVIVSIVILGISSTDQSTSNAINAAVVQPTITIVKKVQSIDPYYTMFAFILVFIVVYIYNQYFASIYKNLRSFQKMGQLGVIYVIFAIVLIYIAFTYFSKRSGGLPSLPSMPAMPAMPTFK
jgi:hypothetical protein